VKVGVRYGGVKRNRTFLNKKTKKNVRAADAKEVGVGNPAEETYCHPNTSNLAASQFLSTPHSDL
jgi:hypothetical protein